MAKRKMMRTPEEIFCGICSESAGLIPETLKHTVILAIEIAREGREGRKIGTLFVVGDSEEVLKHSRSLILDPLYGHPDELKLIHLPDMRETVKELAQLDGAFVVSDEASSSQHADTSMLFPKESCSPSGWAAGIWRQPPSPNRPKPWR